jgi:hypothetical protein
MTTASTPVKPSVLRPNLLNIPEELRNIDAWIGWRLVLRDGRWTKEPVNLKNGGLAKSDDPSTWVPFSRAFTSYPRFKCDGIGLCRTEDYLFIDLDGVLDEAGNVRPFPWAQKILSVVAGRAYIERSVTGTGLHAICHAGALPDGRRQFDDPNLEHTGFAFYDKNRFFTFTGAMLTEGGDIGTLDFTALHAELFPVASRNGSSPKPNLSLSDSEILAKARAAKNGAAFARLFSGQWEGDYPSLSEADEALCYRLAFWTGRDASRIDALYRQSGLYRDKWEREDYREPTIKKAIDGTTEIYEPRNGLTRSQTPPANSGPALPAVCFKSKTTEELMSRTLTRPSELIEGVMPTPGAVLIVGAKKSGKTILAVQTAIAIAARERYLWGQCKINQPGPTLVLEQDDPAGEASLQLIVASSPIPTKGIPFRWECTKNLVIGPDLLYTLEREIREHGLRYVVLDSYTALRPRRKAHTDIVKDEMEDFRCLDDLGKRLNCTIAILHHISHGNAAKSWSERAGGTFGVGLAVEGQIFIDKFPELGIDAPERLVRVEVRHGGSSARVLRFRKETQDYEYVVEGTAAEHWPMLVDLKRHFPSQPFTPKDLFLEMGLSRATSTRIITRLMAAGIIHKVSYGSYRLGGAA